MSPAASLHIDHNLQSSISDVYGNDLENVFVWGDGGSNGPISGLLGMELLKQIQENKKPEVKPTNTTEENI